MERALVFLLSIVFFTPLAAQDTLAGNDSLQRYYTGILRNYLDSKGALKNYYSIDRSGVSMYAGPEKKQKGEAEYRVYWPELETYKSLLLFASREEAMAVLKAKGNAPFSHDVTVAYTRIGEKKDLESTAEKPLLGLRIALDPGHIADDMAMAKTEQKFLDFSLGRSSDTGSVPQRIQLIEGQLTWQTAELLKLKLEKAGATVMMTRPGPGLSAFGTSFHDWRKKYYLATADSLRKNRAWPNLSAVPVFTENTDDRTVFRYVFRDVELRKRIERINAFRPDYTLIIHYNVDEKNTDWQKPTAKNMNMCFIGGSYQAGELEDAERRFDFLRQLLTGDLENSLALSAACARHFRDELKVPLAKQTDALYLSSSCLKTKAEGVYARNLGMTRLVQGTLVYGETLFQDNKNECRLLMQSETDPEFPQLRRSPRAAEVAGAYYNALLETVKAKK